MPTFRGSCHCGAIELEVEGELDHVVHCNCSYCERSGYLHWNVEPRQFRLLRGEGAYRTYQFGTGTSRNHFCTVCGISPFRVPRSDPHLIDINVRCLAGVELASLRVRGFDGAHWEDAIKTREWK